MSEQLTALRDLIHYLSPLHELLDRGLSERTTERIYTTLVGAAEYIDDLETALERPRDDDEDEEERPSNKKPPL
jgi:hypothetical protein